MTGLNGSAILLPGNQLQGLALKPEPVGRKHFVLFLRKNKEAERYYNRLINRHGKSKALSIIAKRLGVAVYYMLKRRKPFNKNMFLNGAMNNPKA